MNNLLNRFKRVRVPKQPAAPAPRGDGLPHKPERKPRAAFSISYTRFSIKEQTFFAKRMAFLITAGVPLIDCLHIIRSQTTSRPKVRVYDTVIADIMNGQFLAASLGRHRRLFGDFAINLIRVGESSGILAQNLRYLADELQKRHELKRKVVGALVYPAFITVATLGVTAMLTAYIFPKLMPIFMSLNVELPMTTRALSAISEYGRAWGLVTVLGVVALAVAFVIVRSRWEALRLMSDRMMLRIPLAGSVARAYNLANFCRTLGLLLKSGVVLTDAVAITGETTKNRAYREACREFSEAVIRGETLSRALERRKDIFPDFLTHMVAIGEKTGHLSQTLIYLAESYEGDVDDLTKNLSSSIEPVLMMVMGVIVGLIAVSVITPIYEITNHLQPK
jgi:type II secretory pathway component PulF